MQSNDAVSFEPPARGGASEVFSTLWQDIATGRLRANDRLPPEDQLAAQFDVAPMTLRQALAQLRSLGLVETKRGRHGGTYIREDIADRLEQVSRDSAVTVADLREITDWRRAVSGEASSLAAQRAETDELERLARFSDEYHDVYLRPNERRLADARFHIYIAELSRNARLLEAEREIQGTLTRILRVVPDAADVQLSDSTHHELVDAITRRDADGARAELYAHVESTYEWGIHQPSVRDRAG